jgi:hypothetical protein
VGCAFHTLSRLKAYEGVALQLGLVGGWAGHSRGLTSSRGAGQTGAHNPILCFENTQKNFVGAPT